MKDWGKYVYYDETSPSFLRWRISRGKSRVVKSGDVVGTLSKREKRYSFVLTIDGEKKRRYNHQIIFELFNGQLADTFEVDHIDGNPTNNRPDNLRKVARKINGRNVAKSSRNSSGVSGVCNFITNGCEYYTATYVTLEGKRKAMNFSVKKLGREKAFELACKARSDAIQLLNQQWAGYTERHGK